MANIYHSLSINGTAENIFEAVSTPAGLAIWWAKAAQGNPAEQSEYELDFGPDCLWRCIVTRYSPSDEFEIEMKVPNADWNGTRIGFTLESAGNNQQLHFRHTGWPELNEHFRVSSYCWAMYLRCLKRYIEQGIVLPYDDRYDG